MSGYNRQEVFVDGDIIEADHANNELDALVAAFDEAIGHKHDGSLDEGPVIGILGDAGLAVPLTKVVVNTIAKTISIFVNVAGVSTEQLIFKDGAIEPSITDDINLGSVLKKLNEIHALKVTGLSTPVDASDAATKDYVDSNALMDSEVTNLAQVKAFDTTDYATSTQGTTADAALPKAGGAMTGDITGLTALDVAGTVTATSHINVGGELNLTAATNNYIDYTDALHIRASGSSPAHERSISIYKDGKVNLNYDSSEKLATTSTGVDVTGTVTADGIALGDNQIATFGTSNDLQIYHDGDRSYISDTGTGDLRLRTNELRMVNAANTEIGIKVLESGAATLYHSGSPKISTTSTGIDITGTVTADGLDVSGIISADNTINIEAASGYANLEMGGPDGAYIDLKSPYSDDFDLRIQAQASATLINATTDLHIQRDSYTKLKVHNTGVDVTGIVNADGIALGDNEKATFGDSDDLQIFHDGDHSHIRDVGTGNLIIRGSSGTYIQGVNGENCIIALEDASVNLYHNNILKLATTATGIDVTGTVNAGGIDVTGSAVAPSLTSNTGISRVQSHTSNEMQFGAYPTAPYGMWIQTKQTNDSGATWPLVLNPLGGNVGIGTSSPSSALDVVGTVTADGLDVSGASTVRAYLTNTGLADTGEKVCFQWDTNANFTLQGRDSTEGFKANWYTIESSAADGYADDHIFYTDSSAERMRINSTGVDVVGTVTADGLTGSSVFRIQSVEGTRGSLQISAPNDGASRSVTYGNNYYMNSAGDYVQESTVIGGALLEMKANNGDYGSFTFKAKQDLDAGGAVADRMVIDSSGNVGICTNSPQAKLSVYAGNIGIDGNGSAQQFFGRAGNVAGTNTTGGVLTVLGHSPNASGDLSTPPYDGTNFVGASGLMARGFSEAGQYRGSLEFFTKTGSTTNATSRLIISHQGDVGLGINSPSSALHINRGGSTETAVKFTNDGGAAAGFVVGASSTGAGLIYHIDSQPILFATASAERLRIDSSGDVIAGADNTQDFGSSSKRWAEIYAGNATINTSDRNEKQDILEITAAERNVATACKGLMRSFRWKSAVAEKGDDARIHFGTIAQDLRDAFTAEGLDAGRYSMFISSTWWEVETEVAAVLAEDAIYETVVTVPAIEAQDAVMSERNVTEIVETGSYVNLAGETIVETKEQTVTTDVVETVVQRQDIDGISTEVEVEVTKQVPVTESYESTPAVVAVAEVTEQMIATKAVEAVDAYTRTDTFETLEDAPEGSTERTRLGVRYPELLSFIIAAM